MPLSSFQNWTRAVQALADLDNSRLEKDAFFSSFAEIVACHHGALVDASPEFFNDEELHQAAGFSAFSSEKRHMIVAVYDTLLERGRICTDADGEFWTPEMEAHYREVIAQLKVARVRDGQHSMISGTRH